LHAMRRKSTLLTPGTCMHAWLEMHQLELNMCECVECVEVPFPYFIYTLISLSLG